MRWFYNLSFRLKLLLPLGAIILATVVFAVLNTVSVNRMQEGAHNIAGVYLPAVTLVLEADRDLHQALIAERGAIAEQPGTDAFRRFQADHGENIAQVRQRMTQVAEISEDPEVDRLVARFFDQFEGWMALTNEVVASAASSPERSRMLSFGDARASFDSTRKTMDLMTGVLHEGAEAAGGTVESQAESVFYRQLIGNAVILGMLALVAVVLPPLVTRVVKLIRDRVEDIAQGEGDLTQRIDVTTKDELGQLACSFNRFMEKLQGTITDVAGYTREVATASQQLSTISEGNTRLVAQQHQSVEMVVTAANEMSSAIQEVARSTSEAAAESQAADRHSVSGKRQLQQTIGAMTGLRESVEDASEVVARLAEEANQIAAVVGEIRDIAEQTNLLALNAAIEAARAGEQGRGFAVVADEVRALAKRTQQSTQNIEDTITRLQGGVKGAVAAMQAGSGKADSTLADARQTELVLEEIAQSVQRISEMSMQIATAAEEQSAVTEDINMNMVSIGDQSRQVAAGAEETSGASGELARLANQLQDSVSQFRV